MRAFAGGNLARIASASAAVGGDSGRSEPVGPPGVAAVLADVARLLRLALMTHPEYRDPLAMAAASPCGHFGRGPNTRAAAPARAARGKPSRAAHRRLRRTSRPPAPVATRPARRAAPGR